MSEVNQETLDQIAVLQKKFKSELKQKIDEIEADKEKFLNSDLSLEHLNSLYAKVHKLTGSSGIFGFSGISQKSEKLEFHLKNLQQAKMENKQVIEKELNSLFRDLEQQVDI